MRKGLLFLSSVLIRAFLLVAGVLFSGAVQSQSALWDLLLLSHEQARGLSYSGVLAMKSEGGIRSSKLLHQKGPAGEFEVFEHLDAPSARWVRLNEQVQCVLPDKKLIVLEKRPSSLWTFPHVFPQAENVRALNAVYGIKESKARRVAGREARFIQLLPKDNYRYEYHFYLDKQKHVLLRSDVFSSQGVVLEQAEFTEISFDVPPLPKTELFQAGPGWSVASTEVKSLKELDLPYSMPDVLVGFKRANSLCRTNAKEKQVHQIVYSDGLSTLSVFVQKVVEGQSLPQMPMAQGAVMSKSEKQGQFLVTAMGEVPEKTLNLFLKSVKWKSQ